MASRFVLHSETIISLQFVEVCIEAACIECIVEACIECDCIEQDPSDVVIM